MKALKTIITLLMVLSILLAFVACGKGGDNKTTTQAPQTEAVDVEITEDQNNETTTESIVTTGNNTTTTTPTTTTTKPVTTTTTQPKAKSYNTISEILDFYKAAANPLKSSDTASATRTKETIKTISGKIPSAYQTFGFKEGDKTEQVKAGAGQKDDMKTKFPVEKKSFVCDLTEDDVDSATCTLSGDVYTVTINVKDDDEGTFNRSEKCVSTINFILIGKWTCKGVQVKATIKDGKLLTLYYNMPTYVTSLTDAFAFSLEQWWTVNSY